MTRIVQEVDAQELKDMLNETRYRIKTFSKTLGWVYITKKEVLNNIEDTDDTYEIEYFPKHNLIYI